MANECSVHSPAPQITEAGSVSAPQQEEARGGPTALSAAAMESLRCLAEVVVSPVKVYDSEPSPTPSPSGSPSPFP